MAKLFCHRSPPPPPPHTHTHTPSIYIQYCSPMLSCLLGEKYCRGWTTTTDVSSVCNDVNRDQQYGRGSTGTGTGSPLASYVTTILVLHVHNESSASDVDSQRRRDLAAAEQGCR